MTAHCLLKMNQSKVLSATCDAVKPFVMRTWPFSYDCMDSCRARISTRIPIFCSWRSLLCNFPSIIPSLIRFSSSSLATVVTVTTRPSSPRCRCRTHHAHESLTRSRWCPSQRPPRATTDAEGEVSLWPSTSHSATAPSRDTQLESHSESVC